MEFNEHNVEFGYSYTSSAVLADDIAPPVPIDPIRIYTPSTRPGAPLPHADIDDADGIGKPLMNLVKPGHFLLIAGEDGRAWCDAAKAVAKDLGIPLDAVTIGHIEGDYRDPRSAWIRQREISAQGAVLVRPDRVVAWRSMGAAKSPTAELAGALSKVLGRA